MFLNDLIEYNPSSDYERLFELVDSGYKIIVLRYSSTSTKYVFGFFEIAEKVYEKTKEELKESISDENGNYDIDDYIGALEFNYTKYCFGSTSVKTKKEFIKYCEENAIIFLNVIDK